MIKNKITLKNKKALITITATAVTSILLVVSIAIIGSARFSNQQQQEEQSDVASDATRNGNVQLKTNDFDFSAGEGQGSGGGGFELQTTERSNSVTFSEFVPGGASVSVQCNSDETVTGGGFEQTQQSISGQPDEQVLASKKLNNGWTVTMIKFEGTITVYAECAKIVPATT
jgi:hypothetical protein